MADVTTWAHTVQLGTATVAVGEMFSMTMRETGTQNVVVYNFSATAATRANLLNGLKTEINLGALYTATVDTATNTLTAW